MKNKDKEIRMLVRSIGIGKLPINSNKFQWNLLEVSAKNKKTSHAIEATRGL